MRIATLIAIGLLVLATGAMAKEAYDYPEVVNNLDRQGGENIATAALITEMPVSLAGTTAGYAHDYDEVCDYDIPGAADVVYAFEPCMDGVLEATLCNGSVYDTKMYVYENDEFNLVACNDDFCPGYISELTYASGQPIPVSLGNVYYFVVDGWSPGDEGDYVLDIWGMDCTVATEDASFSTVKGLY